MNLNQINLLLYGTIEEQEKIKNRFPHDPAVILDSLLLTTEVTISAIQDVVYSYTELSLSEIYYRVSQGDLTEAEMKAIADLFGVEVTAIWGKK